MKRKLMLLLACLFVGIGLVTAQTQTITGVVISEEDGQPVIGASVLVKGTQIGTITGVDGDFTLPNVPSSAKTLQISYIGMQTQEVAIKSHVKVTMKSDSEILEEVMVVAYGTAKKSAFTGSASVVSSDQIGKIQTSNVANALTGKVSGVQLNTTSGQPGATTPTIRVRGISSINAAKDPLIVLDGIPYDGDLNNISSQDIESMTVLKDAASSALYGARGANGVIIITTKKGNAGQAKITVDAKWGSNSRATQDYNYVTSPAKYYEMYYGALKNYFTNTQGMDSNAAHIMANQNLTANNAYGLGYNVYNVPTGQYMIGENGKLNPNATLGQNYLLLPDDWTDAAYKNGLRQEYTVTATAGSDKSSFYASFNYLDNEGIANNSDYERLTGRMKADYQIKDWLKVGANMAYTHYESNQLGDDGSSNSSGNVFALTQMAPIYPLYLRDGNGVIMKDANGITRYDYGDGSNAGNSRPYLGQSNALSSSILDKMNAEGNAISAVGFFEVRFLKDFKFSSTNSVYVDEMRQTNVTNPYYGQYASSNGIAYKYHTRQLSYNYQQLLNYKKSFGPHNVEAMLGHESYRYKYYYLYASKSNMFDPNNPELIGAILDGSANSYTKDYNTEGYFGRIQYDFNEKYFVSGSYRRDASSRFHPDNRWGNFWSLGGAWLISKEDFFNVEWIDELKLKASYGSQGNDNIGDYRYITTYEIVNANGNPAAVPYAMGNKDITWETNGNFNVGIDFAVLKNRLSGTVEYFNRRTSDMLFSFPLPPTMGFTSYYSNVGDMRNTGIELSLNADAIRTKDFDWNISLNLAHNENEVTRLSNDVFTMDKILLGDVFIRGGSSSGTHVLEEGRPIGQFYGLVCNGIDENGRYILVDKDGDGEISDPADYDYIGSAQPKLTYGITNSFRYKNFDLSFFLRGTIGNDILNATRMAYAQSGFLPGTNALDDPLTYTLSETPRFSNYYLEKGSFMRLDNLTLGYKIKALNGIRVYFTAQNLFVITKYKGLDPEVPMDSGDGLTPGVEPREFYPKARTFSVGLNLNF